MQKKKGRSFDCGVCKDRRPELMEENTEAWELWNLVGTQWRATGFGVIGLDWPAVELVAKIHGIRVTPGIYRKFRMLEEETLGAGRK